MKCSFVLIFFFFFFHDLHFKKNDIKNSREYSCNDREIVRKFIALVKAHFTTKKFVSDYADDLCVSPNYLNFVIKKITGYPASYHIHQYIVLEAKRHATHTRLSNEGSSGFFGI